MDIDEGPSVHNTNVTIDDINEQVLRSAKFPPKFVNRNLKFRKGVQSLVHAHSSVYLHELTPASLLPPPPLEVLHREEKDTAFPLQSIESTWQTVQWRNRAAKCWDVLLRTDQHFLLG